MNRVHSKLVYVLRDNHRSSNVLSSIFYSGLLDEFVSPRNSISQEYCRAYWSPSLIPGEDCSYSETYINLVLAPQKQAVGRSETSL